jgi:hypothetical protein
MAHLRLTGVSDDGAHLRLVDEEGIEHLLAVDDRLRAAVRPSTTAAPPESRGMEKTMESTLRPRDIQARIRSGETPEAVAQAAQTSVERIMTYAAPVLAERQHMADRAQRSSVRRSDGGQAANGARTLGDAVAAQLRALNVDPQTVTWDAWRREDGRWMLTGEFTSEGRSGAAQLTFDPPGNYVTLDNDDARWLVGDGVVARSAPEPADDLHAVRQRRLSVAGADPDVALPLGDDAIDLVTEQPVEAFLDPELPVEALLDTEPPTDEQVVAQEAELREEAADAAAEEHEHEEPAARRPVKKTRGRASVPSWDEIMFGGKSEG